MRRGLKKAHSSAPLAFFFFAPPDSKLYLLDK
jgi:hypothetical protein